MAKVKVTRIDDATKDRWPELTKIAMKIAKQVGNDINSEAKKVKSEMPYKAQGILEKLIQILEEAV